MKSESDQNGKIWRQEDLEFFIERLPGGFLRCSMDGTISYASVGILELYGCEDEEQFKRCFGGSFREMVYEEDYEQAAKEIAEQLESGQGSAKTEFRIRRPDGQIRWVDCRGRGVLDESGKRWYYGVLIDDTEAKMARQRYWEQAHLDALTGLLNKNACKALIDPCLTRGSGICALLVLDVDNFKYINDTWGHLFGDTVLTEIARRIKSLFRRNDVVGRVGGDEFVVFLRELTEAKQALYHGKRMVQSLMELQNSLKNAVEVTCSVGIAIYPWDGSSFEQLYERADVALYYSKRAGKNQSLLYDGSMTLAGESGRGGAEAKGRTQPSYIESETGLSKVNQQIIQYVFRALYDSVNLEEAIRLIMQIIGRQFDVSRVYIFEDRPDGLVTDNTFEWCNEGVEPEIDVLQNLSYESDIPGYTGNFDENGIFFCPDVRLLEKRQRELLEVQGVKSILQCGIYDNGRFVGFMGFDECRQNRQWRAVQIDALSFVARILGTFLVKDRAKKQLERQIGGLEEILDKLPGWVYAVDADTYQLYYLNQKTKEIAPDSRIGKCCYREFMGLDQPCRECPARESLKTGTLASMEIYNGYLNIWSNASGIPIVWEGKDAVLLFLQDITKYKRAAAYLSIAKPDVSADGWAKYGSDEAEGDGGQSDVPVTQDDSVAIYGPPENMVEDLIRYGVFNSRKTVTAAALEIFERQKSFAGAVQMLLGFLGRRYSLSRVSLYMNDAWDSGKNTIYQWVDNQTAVPISLSDCFRKEEFFICYGLYDEKTTAVLTREKWDTYSENLKRVMDQSGAKTVMFAGIYIDGRYAGQLALVSCTEERRWQKKERGEVSEIASLISSEAKALTELDNAKKRAEYYRNVDLLTGLFTYDKFKQEAQKALVKDGKKRVLVASDIKGFKYINSTLGYTQGDNILRMFADMMVQSSGSGVINARANGDVFLTLGVYEDQDQFMEALQKSNEDFARIQNQIYVGVNVMIRSGVYFVEPECREIGSAVDRANLARKSVDYILKSTVVPYRADPFTRQQRENEMINRMEYALEHGEFQVYYQPKILLEDGSVEGAEALIRWVKEDGEIVPPGEFVPLFEKNGFITKLDIFVLESVCGWLKERAGQGLALIKVSVNLSAVDIRKPDIVPLITAHVEKCGIPPRFLEFELTETAFLNDTARTFVVLESLQEKGFATSIDDFGSGYSIMNMVTEIPTDIIKMDCLFVQNCVKTERGQEFLGQLLQMVRKMGFVALCEGIETGEQLQMVKEMGCVIGQGYHFARPMPVEKFEAWLEEKIPSGVNV